jgi:predicted dehydrogenase/threonine dehydrogenase-like Zn-dependent dehydrogenase
MKQVVQNYKTGDVSVIDIPIPTLKSEGLLVQNAYSLISVGTERMKVEQASMNLLAKARARPDQVRKVLNSIQQQGLVDTYQKVMDRLDSLTPLGYSSAGIVKEVGSAVTNFTVGDRVACAGAGYANHAEFIYVPRNLCAKIPEEVSLQEAAFCTVGTIALQGVRQAGAVVGDNVAVIGLGLVGLLTVQILRAAGCRTVGIDIEESRTAIAMQLGCDLGLVRGEQDDPTMVSGFTGGRGVDAVIITAATSSSDPIDLASHICRDRGRIVVVGAIRVDISNTLKSDFYEKELELFMSRSYGPGRYDSNYEEKGRDYPVGYVRWTEGRNMEAFLDLLASGAISVQGLMSHRFSLDEAPKAYELLVNDRARALTGVLFEYDVEADEAASIRLSGAESLGIKARDQVGVGLIGAGNHTRAKLLPPLGRTQDVCLRGVATATGLTARDVGDKFGFAYCTSDYRELLTDPEIDAILITTRHNLHAPLVVEALSHKKAVFVEKPLATDLEGLGQIVEAYRTHQGRVLVGFNRRFAPHSQRLREFFAAHTAPLVLIYRINAGYQAPDNWYQDPIEGGGRIVGEGGHFVDLMTYIVGAHPVQVYARALPDPALPIPDNVSLMIDFADGSVGNLVYTAGGDVTFPKERLEVFGQGQVGVLDDFRALTLVSNGRRKKRRDRLTQDKGHAAQLNNFVAAVKGEIPWPVSFEEHVTTTLVTLLAMRSLQEGQPVKVDPSTLALSELPE